MAHARKDATVAPLFGFGRVQIDDETEYRQRAVLWHSYGERHLSMPAKPLGRTVGGLR
jgi:hypothetical protein